MRLPADRVALAAHPAARPPTPRPSRRNRARADDREGSKGKPDALHAGFAGPGRDYYVQVWGSFTQRQLVESGELRAPSPTG